MTDLVKQLVGALEGFMSLDRQCLRDIYGSEFLSSAEAALTAAKAGGWQTLERAPVGREMFVVIGVTSGNEFTGGRPYTTDPYCVCQPEKGEFSRWPHAWPPTHWQPLPTPPKEQS